MKVGIIQSSFIPWRGYFDFINNVDCFVFHEDVQFTYRDWRTRNRIKTRNGTKWLSIPVIKDNQGTLLVNKKISYSYDWIKAHRNLWKENYSKAPFFEDIIPFLDIINYKFEKISDLNIELIKSICQYLNINTTFINSSELNTTGYKTEKIINILKTLNATEYLSGSNADNYLNKQLFIDSNISLEYKSYDYLPYQQLWGEFQGQVSILDLIANCGTNTRKYINSLTPNIKII